MKPSLPSILGDRYGVTVLSSPVEAILWSADRLLAALLDGTARGRQQAIKTATAELRAANRQRERAGRMPAYVPYGHPLF